MMCPSCQNGGCETCIITQKLTSCCFCRTRNSSDLRQHVMDWMLKKEHVLRKYNEINTFSKQNKHYKKIKFKYLNFLEIKNVFIFQKIIYIYIYIY